MLGVRTRQELKIKLTGWEVRVNDDAPLSIFSICSEISSANKLSTHNALTYTVGKEGKTWFLPMWLEVCAIRKGIW